MKETGIVPVFFNNNVEIAQNVVKACYEGGIRAFEFTNRGDFAIEVFKELSKFVLAECPGLSSVREPFWTLQRQLYTFRWARTSSCHRL